MKLLVVILTMHTVMLSGLAPSEPDSLLDEIQCTAWWRRSDHDKPERLDPKRDAKRALNPGEAVKCDSAGLLKLIIHGQWTVVKDVGVWHTIPPSSVSDPTAAKNPQTTASAEAPDSIRRAQAIERYLRRGGRARGQGRERVAIRPEDFVIAWEPRSGPLTLELLTENYRSLWKGTVDGPRGEFAAEAVRRAVLEYQHSGGGILNLVLIGSAGKQEREELGVISVDDEEHLRQRLARWETEPSAFMRHLGRAQEFKDSNLFFSAAREYEAALADAPQSRQLLIATILAYRDARDPARAQQLVRRLPPGTELPAP